MVNFNIFFSQDFKCLDVVVFLTNATGKVPYID